MQRIILSVICILMLGTLIVGCGSPNTSSGAIELSLVQEKLELGMSKTEVKAIFGRAYTSVHDTFDGHELWRFDSVSEKGYTSAQATDTKVAAPYDRSGLVNGKLISQLFIGWTDDHLVSDVTFYYIKSGKIYVFYILKNGQSGELRV